MLFWGELPAERKMPGVFRVLVGGQHAGAIERHEGRAAYWFAGMTGSGRRGIAPASMPRPRKPFGPSSAGLGS